MESLITFSIVGIFLALTWATVNFLLLKTTEQIVRTRAHFLVTEGVERVMQIRQTAVNRNRENGFVSAIGSKSGNYILGQSGDEFTLTYGENENIEMEEEPYTTYCRTVAFTGDSQLIKQVAVTVRWGDPIDCSEGNEVISYSTYLADNTQ
ncbi:hypothetical protein KJ742_02520 [Patescibacteria group bacterium]|nr:hypothetical protein [Patescibacteria group bacterium]MBU1935398.1 hypothetical protein [Patescibacteria group bacterium]